jgi:alkylation response protein AidB-like acyl-CoA dehydrogenase
MDFTFDSDQLALQGTARAVLGDAYGEYARRRAVVRSEAGFDLGLYRRLGELGLLGLPFPEHVGGSGAGWAEATILVREAGRVLAPEPLLASAFLAGGLVAVAGTEEQQTELLGPLCAGDRVLALAHHEARARSSGAGEGVITSQSGGSWRLSGTKEPVPFGAEADLLVVSAHLPRVGTGLFLVETDAPGLAISGYRTFAGGPAAKVHLDETPATPLGPAGTDVTPVICQAIDTARVLAGQEALGAMRAALALTTSYLKQRRQFGVTLNTFQDLTFRATDMYVEIELTESLVQWATMVLDDGDRRAIADASTRAGLQVARASRLVAQESIQLHGGIGMTSEYAVGAYAQRLVELGQFVGIEERHLGQLAGAVDTYDVIDPTG